VYRLFQRNTLFIIKQVIFVLKDEVNLAQFYLQIFEYDLCKLNI
jgi:hypothetical protein